MGKSWTAIYWEGRALTVVCDWGTGAFLGQLLWQAWVACATAVVNAWAVSSCNGALSARKEQEVWLLWDVKPTAWVRWQLQRGLVFPLWSQKLVCLVHGMAEWAWKDVGQDFCGFLLTSGHTVGGTGAWVSVFMQGTGHCLHTWLKLGSVLYICNEICASLQGGSLWAQWL